MTTKTYTAGEAGLLALFTPVMAVLIVAAILPFTCLNAYVAMKLWNWFPAVYFHLQPISFWMMLGLVFSIGFVRQKISYKDHNIDWMAEFVGWAFAPPITLGLGYLIHLKIS